MTKTLKIIASLVFVLFIFGFIGLLAFVYTLPSAWELKKKIMPQKVESPAFVAKTPTALPDKTAESTPTPTPAETHADTTDEMKTESLQVLHDDFMNSQRPLSDACGSLANASTSHFLRRDESASYKQFTKSLLSPEKDPLVEAAASVFRFVFREGEMQDLVRRLEHASAEGDSGLLRKTEFYGQAAIAMDELRNDKSTLDHLLMKSYNLFILAKAAGLHAELARDPATLSFCSDLEKNINLNLDFNAEDQAQQMRKFLDYAKITPQEVGYDPSYRSDIQFSLLQNSLLMQNIWLDKIFATDLQKAEKQLNPPPPEEGEQ